MRNEKFCGQCSDTIHEPAIAYRLVKTLPDGISTPCHALLAYVGAFHARDARCIRDLSANAAVYDLPMIVADQLYGKSDVYDGHTFAFCKILNSEMSLRTMSNVGTIAKAKGEMTLQMRAVKGRRFALEIFCDFRLGKIHRLGLFCKPRRR